MTLDQVRKAGRFAWHDYGVYVPERGEVYRVSVYMGDEVSEYRPPNPSYIDGFHEDLTGANIRSEFDEGWTHLPGCDCEFCRE